MGLLLLAPWAVPEGPERDLATALPSPPHAKVITSWQTSAKSSNVESNASLSARAARTSFSPWRRRTSSRCTEFHSPTNHR